MRFGHPFLTTFGRSTPPPSLNASQRDATQSGIQISLFSKKAQQELDFFPAEGVRFELTVPNTRDSGFRNRRTRPLCDPSF